MKYLPASKMLGIVRNTLNLVDPRLVDHGNRVAKLMGAALEPTGRYSRKEMRDIAIASILHDIGAYKTEEIDQMVAFETNHVWDHSIYGYLYLKNFSPLADISPSLLFHHADHSVFSSLRGDSYFLGQMIHIADRIDILAQNQGEDPRFVRDYFAKRRGNKFSDQLVDLFVKTDAMENAWNGYRLSHLDDELEEEAVESYINMVVLSIDFRSEQTVNHTIATAAGAEMLAEMMSMPAETVDMIYTGAMLHDLGKQGIPSAILESPNRLTPDEMAIMRQHVVLSGDVLAGNIDETIRQIAVRHHERLDGSGYPCGMTAHDLTMPERIVAVADVLSALAGVRSYKDAFPKERIAAILGGMAKDGQLDQQVVDLTLNNLDALMDRLSLESAQAVRAYQSMRDEFHQLSKQVADLESGEQQVASFARYATEVF
ncbi:MAG: HD domain-containing protein [Planctomycetes bacterium]|nr:HD domain-containing protein [Planctomycetota bacterium]